jgi:hypothetical protein
MDIPLNAKISCSDGTCGQSTYLILKPTNEEITHVVVSDGSFPETEYLVPIDRIVESTPDSIQLNCSLEELSKMPVFNQVEFIPSDSTDTHGNPYMMWPFVVPETYSISVENEHIPANELAIRRGANVEATDGRIGHVDEFLIDPADDTISHLVLREGHLWGQKNITIPLSQIDHIDENTVWLKLDKQSIEALPAIPIRRRANEE